MADFWRSLLSLLNQTSCGSILTVIGFVYVIFGLRTLSDKKFTLSTTIIGVLNGWSKPQTLKGKKAQFIGKILFVFGMFLTIVGMLITIGEIWK